MFHTRQGLSSSCQSLRLLGLSALGASQKTDLPAQLLYSCNFSSCTYPPSADSSDTLGPLMFGQDQESNKLGSFVRSTRLYSSPEGLRLAVISLWSIIACHPLRALNTVYCHYLCTPLSVGRRCASIWCRNDKSLRSAPESRLQPSLSCTPCLDEVLARICELEALHFWCLFLLRDHSDLTRSLVSGQPPPLLAPRACPLAVQK